nr:hypothetical protein C4D60_Mb04t02340 [Ipomoea batatas]GMC68083.1 hypothetical protein C4D60_Mb04t02340 [Ipomoea batatas]
MSEKLLNWKLRSSHLGALCTSLSPGDCTCSEQQLESGTGKLPGVELVEINIGDNGNGDRLGGAFPAEIVHHQLIVGGMEPETGSGTRQRNGGRCEEAGVFIRARIRFPLSRRSSVIHTCNEMVDAVASVLDVIDVVAYDTDVEGEKGLENEIMGMDSKIIDEEEKRVKLVDGIKEKEIETVEKIEKKNVEGEKGNDELNVLNCILNNKEGVDGREIKPKENIKIKLEGMDTRNKTIS